MKRIWRTSGIDPALGSLVLRNLIVVLLKRGDFAKAEELLALGARAYTDYAELHYLSGLMWVRRKKPSNAIAPLEAAIRLRSAGFVGSGGENSYRAHWLLGVVYDFAGNQGRAVEYCSPGLYTRPAFQPSVELILRQRMAPEIAASYRVPLCEIARREPQYFGPVFNFLLAHRLFEMAHVLLDTSPLLPDVRQALDRQLESSEAPFKPPVQKGSAKPGVILKGPFFAHSGHARINREIGRALASCADLETIHESQGWNSVQPVMLPDGERLRKGMERQVERLDLTIRHQWPPEFRRPRAG